MPGNHEIIPQTKVHHHIHNKFLFPSLWGNYEAISGLLRIENDDGDGGV